MDSVSRLIPICGRAALLATACLLAPLHAGEPAKMAGNQASRNRASIEEARELLLKGDEAYEAGRYAEAAEAFGGARELLPDEGATAELRAAATERFATASVQRGRELARKGDIEGARKVVDKVLADGVAPGNVDARCFREQLDDPIRTNPALTAEHGKNVDAVRRALYTAEGAFNLGKYDQAKAECEKVLRIDPTNTAARRWMERIATAKSDHYQAASDHARAERLMQVDKAWELAVPPAAPVVPALDGGAATTGAAISVSAKIDRIIIPQIDLEQISLEDAVDFLRAQSRQYDTLETDPQRKGVNITVQFRGGGEAEMDKKVQAFRFNLRLRNVPVSQALRYIAELTHTTVSTDDFAVVLRPAGASATEMVSRTFRVPPDFLSTASSSAAAAPAADPFAEKPAEGLLSKRRGAEEVLKDQGVTFPEGAFATLNVATNTLMVRNSEANVDMIAQIIEAAAKTEPVQVVVRVTVIKTEEHRLQELGFDWLLNDFGLGGTGFAPGVDALTLSGGTRGNGGDLGDIPLAPGSSNRRPITAGNRSGTEAIAQDSIDSLIASQSTGKGTATSRAPGALWLNGMVNGSDFQMLMRGLDQKKGVDLMANPSVVTRSGQAASVHIVREFIYPTEYEPPELPNSVGNTVGRTPVTPATPTAFQKRDVGIVLEVLPTVSADKRFVEIDLNPSITDFDGFVNYGSPINASATSALGKPSTVEVTKNAILMPVFSTQRTKTNLTVADGSTIVIGGMIEEHVQNVEDQTPVLGNLPVVGRLFQSKAVSPVKKAVLFLVNVQLQDPSGHPINSR